MFKIQAEPTFDACLTIVGQGREQKLNVTFNHKTRSEYSGMLEAVAEGKLATADCLLQLLSKWDADAELGKEAVEALQEQQPGVDWAIITAYGDALKVARKGN